MDREQAIRQMAYALWESEGSPHGRHLAHWRAAEVRIAQIEAAVEESDKSSAIARPVEAAPKKTAVKKAKAKAPATPAAKKAGGAATRTTKTKAPQA